MLNAAASSLNIQHSTLNIPRLSLVLLAMAFAQETPPSDPLAAMKIHVTTGAAPGYVDDKHCATCHSDVAHTYRQVGMSKSFYRPRADDAMEDFTRLPFRHQR